MDDLIEALSNCIHVTYISFYFFLNSWYVAFIIGETAEMPGMYSAGEYDIAGFAVGAVERVRVLPQLQSITVDDVVIGLASSGIHSNGFSLVRQIIDKSDLSYSSPSPFSTTEGLQSVTKLGEVLLVPTRIYCRSVLPLMRDGKVKAFAHITGLFSLVQ